MFSLSPSVSIVSSSLLCRWTWRYLPRMDKERIIIPWSQIPSAVILKTTVDEELWKCFVNMYIYNKHFFIFPVFPDDPIFTRCKHKNAMGLILNNFVTSMFTGTLQSRVWTFDRFNNLFLNSLSWYLANLLVKGISVEIILWAWICYLYRAVSWLSICSEASGL